MTFHTQLLGYGGNTSPRPIWRDLCPHRDLGSPHWGLALSRGICFPGQEHCTLVVESQGLGFPSVPSSCCPGEDGVKPFSPPVG